MVVAARATASPHVAELEAAPPPPRDEGGGGPPVCLGGVVLDEDEDGGLARLVGGQVVGRGGEVKDEVPVAELANPWPWHGPSEGDDDGFSATVYPRARSSAPVSTPWMTTTCTGEAAVADPSPAEGTRHHGPAAQGPRPPAPPSEHHSATLDGHALAFRPRRPLSRGHDAPGHVAREAPRMASASPPEAHLRNHGLYAPAPRPVVSSSPSPGLVYDAAESTLLPSNAVVPAFAAGPRRRLSASPAAHHTPSLSVSSMTPASSTTPASSMMPVSAMTPLSAMTSLSPPPGYPTPPLAAHSPANPLMYGTPQPTYAPPPPPPAPAGFPPHDPHRSPQLAGPQPPGPPGRPATTPEPSPPPPHPYSYSPRPPEPFYSTSAAYPDPRLPHGAPPPPHQPGGPYAAPYYPPQPTYAAAADAYAPYRPAAYPPPLPPRSAPGPYAQPLAGFASDPRNAVPYPPPPMTMYTPPLPAARHRASSGGLFSGSSARRWLDKTSQMLESKLDEVLQGQQGRPAYGPGAGPPGSSMGGGPPAPGHGGHPGGSWGGGSYRYA